MRPTALRLLVIGLIAGAWFPRSATALDGAAPAYLPDPTCAPVARALDDAANAYQPAESAVVKVIYAHAADAPDAIAAIYPDLAQGVRDMTEYVYIESGERRSIRFDLGTTAGSDCVDVQDIALPHPASYYDPDNISAARQKAVADIQLALGAQPGPRDYLVFLDGVPNNFRSAITGSASGGTPSDDSPGGPSWQAGGFYSVIFDNDFDFGVSTAFGKVGVHELFHAFGAVQSTAPHYGGGGHCTEQHDVMCDASFDGPTLCEFAAYPTISWETPQGRLDCGSDDYFSPEPAADSYLATHWNTYDSAFLCAVGTCVSDNVAPRTKIKGPGRTTDRTPTFRLRGDEAPVSFKCKLDREPMRACAARYSPSRLPTGRHVLRAVAIDGAGNADETRAVKRFKIVRR